MVLVKTDLEDTQNLIEKYFYELDLHYIYDVLWISELPSFYEKDETSFCEETCKDIGIVKYFSNTVDIIAIKETNLLSDTYFFNNYGIRLLDSYLELYLSRRKEKLKKISINKFA